MITDEQKFLLEKGYSDRIISNQNVKAPDYVYLSDVLREYKEHLNSKKGENHEKDH